MHLTGSSPNCILPKDYRIKTTLERSKIPIRKSYVVSFFLRHAYAVQVLAYAVAFFDNSLREAYATWRRPFLVIHAEFSSDSDLKKKTMKMNQTKQTQVGGRAEKG